MLPRASEMHITALPQLTGPDELHPVAGTPINLFLAAVATCIDTRAIWVSKPTRVHTVKCV